MPASKTRRVSIHVVDQNLNPIRGADIEFRVGGIAAGGVQSSAGRAMLELEDPMVAVEVQVTVLSETRTSILSPGDDLQTFQFEFAPQLSPAPGPPVARCANGATGQPCVDCMVAGRTVHICP